MFSSCFVISDLSATFYSTFYLKCDFSFTVTVNTPQKLCFITAEVVINVEIYNVLLLKMPHNSVYMYVFRTLLHEWFCKKWPGFQSDFQLLSSAGNVVAILDLGF